MKSGITLDDFEEILKKNGILVFPQMYTGIPYNYKEIETSDVREFLNYASKGYVIRVPEEYGYLYICYIHEKKTIVYFKVITR